jgi:hypothetical protein
VPRSSGPVFIFCAPGLIFGGTKRVGCCFHVLRFRTRFRRYWGVKSHFLVLRSQTHFRRYLGRRVPFSYFARPDSFSAAPRASGPVFMFCAPGLIFSGTEGVGSHFHVLRSWTRLQRYQGCRVPFYCFERSRTHLQRASGPVFMFCAPGLIFGGTDCVPSRFHVFRSLTCFQRHRRRQVPFLCFALPDMFSTAPTASGPIFMFCTFIIIFGGAEFVGSRFHVLRTRTHFRWY